MDIAYQIGLYLQNAGFGTLGTSIFIGDIPQETEGFCVVRSGGDAEFYLPIETSLLDIYCYDHSSASAVQSLEEVKRFVHRMYDTNTASAKIYSILLVQDITDISRDAEAKKIYKISVQVKHRATTLIS